MAALTGGKFPGNLYLAHDLCWRRVKRWQSPSRRVLAWPWHGQPAQHSNPAFIYDPPGATVREWGDRVPNGSRVVPFFATLRFELDGAQPSLTAEITNAVLEGGLPFALTVHSLSGSRLVDGTYKFTGDYLRDIYPSGTQYLFDWRFSTTSDGSVVWNGYTYWAGGHIWQVTVSNLTLVPAPWLNISRAGTTSVQITWATNFADHVLEYATSLPAPGWTTVTNGVTNAEDRFSVTLDTDIPSRFYRLRKP